MAAQSDGSIVVEAGINAEGFTRGSEALKQAVSRLQKRFDSVAKQLQHSVALYEKALSSGNIESVQRFSDKLDRARGAASRFREELSKYGAEYRTISANIDKAQAALSRLEDRQAKMDATGVKENSQAYQNLMYDMRRAQQTLAEYKADLSAALGVKDGVDVTLANPKEFQALGEAIERTKEKLSELQNDEGVDSLVAGIEKAEAALDRYQAKVEKMSALGATDKAWESVGYDIDKAAENVEEYRTQVESLKNYGAIDDERYDQLLQTLSGLQAKADEARNAVNSALTPAFDEAARSADNAARGASPLAVILGTLTANAVRATTAMIGLTSAAFLSFMRVLARSAGEAAQNLASMASHAVTGGIRRLGAWLSNAAKSMTLFGRSARKNNGILKKSFSTILKYGLGVRSFYFLFRKIRQAIGEGYQNLARYSDNLNQSISGVI